MPYEDVCVSFVHYSPNTDVVFGEVDRDTGRVTGVVWVKDVQGGLIGDQ